jgi:hypothetical protein
MCSAARVFVTFSWPDVEKEKAVYDSKGYVLEYIEGGRLESIPSRNINVRTLAHI